MHIDTPNIDAMQLPELDELRHQLRLSKRELCRRAQIDASTYTRWMRQLAGLAGGSCPQPRSVKAIREVLRELVASQAAISAKAVRSREHMRRAS